jgi:hypothetical protein
MGRKAKEYRVSLLENTCYAAWVEASSPDKAISKAKAMLAANPLQFKVMDSSIDDVQIIDERELDYRRPCQPQTQRPVPHAMKPGRAHGVDQSPANAERVRVSALTAAMMAWNLAGRSHWHTA